MADIDETRWPSGQLHQRWDHNEPRTYSEYDESGSLVVQRAFTPEEIAMSNARLATAAAAANDAGTSSKLQTIDFPAMQAILSQTNADLRADPSQEIKDIAKAVRRLTRKVEHLTDGTE